MSEKSDEMEMFQELRRWCHKYHAVIYCEYDNRMWICAGDKHYRMDMVSENCVSSLERVTFEKVQS